MELLDSITPLLLPLVRKYTLLECLAHLVCGAGSLGVADVTSECFRTVSCSPSVGLDAPVRA
jgi:hypothetical protein